MKQENSFGYFQSNGTEFVVTEQETPRALVNYSWNKKFISGVSQHGGGDGVYKERAMQYIDQRGRNLMVKNGHRYFYIHDCEDAKVWSPGWHPVQEELDAFKCIHGLGYSKFESSKSGIETKMRMFVPEKEACEIWTITLKNTNNFAKKLKFFTFVDWLLQGYSIYCDYFACLSSEYHEDINAIHAKNRAIERQHDFFDGFVASDIKPSGYDSSRKKFLGSFGHVKSPKAVVKGSCTNSIASCEYMVGVLEHTIELAANDSITFNVIIGATNGVEDIKATTKALFSNPETIEIEFNALIVRNNTLVNKVKINVPNSHVNYLMNGWLKKQIQIYSEVGSDNGRGFRDALQLLWATASFDLDYTRRMMQEALRHQFADGHTLRGWLPTDDHHYSDGPVWIAPALEAYLIESGDYDFLNVVVPYFDGGEATILDHMLQGLRHSSDDTGEHGMVKMHFGDWNDSLTGIGIAGKGESVWTTIGIIYSLKTAINIVRNILNDKELEAELLERVSRLTAAINKSAWDGEWFLRGINDYGNKVGTHTETEGRIYLLPQVWAVLADIVDDERKEALFKAVDTLLESDYGSLTLAPAFTHRNDKIGRLTAFEPGIWENGSPYCHSNGFKIIADCVGGRGNEAWKSYEKAMPDNPITPSTHSGCEPYAFTNQYLGPDNKRAGETQFAWMTGTAGWYFRAMSEYIIGVRGDFKGLKVDPCLPDFWESCSIERDFRGARYHVEIDNPNGIQKGKVELVVDGKLIEGNIVPFFTDGKAHEVKATITTI
jgi:cellobiose phosphorylase